MVPWAFYTSDLFTNQFPPYLVADQFYMVPAPIKAVHFWGLTLIYNNGWYECNNEDPMTFEIKFYEIGYEELGEEDYSEVVTLTKDYTDDDYSGYYGYHFRAELSVPVDLATGWISIQGISYAPPENCIFLWQNSFDANGHALQNGGVIY